MRRLRLSVLAVLGLVLLAFIESGAVESPFDSDEDALIELADLDDEASEASVPSRPEDAVDAAMYELDSFVERFSKARKNVRKKKTKEPAKEYKKKLQIDYSKPCKQPATYVFVVDTRVNFHYLQQAMLDNVCEDFAYEGSSCSIHRSTKNNGGISHWDMDAALKSQQMEETAYRLNSSSYRVKDTTMWRKRPHLLILLVNGTDTDLKKQVLKTSSLDEEGALCDWQVAVWALGKVPIDPKRKKAMKKMDKKLTSAGLGLVKYGIKTYEYNTVATKDPNNAANKLIFPAKLHWLQNPQIIMRNIFYSACKAAYQN